MKRVWVLTAFLLGPAWAGAAFPQSASNPLTGIERGQRVDVTTESGSHIRGYVQYVDDTRIRIDVSLENPELNGIVSCARDKVVRVAILPELSEAEKERIWEDKEVRAESLDRRLQEILAERERIRQAQIQRGAAAGEAATTAAANDEAKRKEDELTRALSLVDKFPPTQGWSQDQFNWLSRKFIVTGVALTAEEKEFVDNFALWKQGLDFVKAKQEEAEKAASPGGGAPQGGAAPTGETPAPSGGGSEGAPKAP